MSLPYSSIVPISGVVTKPAFTVEKKHILLAMVNDLIPSTVPALEFSGSSAVTDFGAYFGQSVPEYAAIQKYFSFLAKSGSAPDKAVVARWYKTAAAAFIKGGEVVSTITDLSAVTDGSIGLTLDGVTAELKDVDLSGVTSYSEVATKLQDAMQTDFAGSTVAYNSLTKGFIITGATQGSEGTAGAVTAGTEGTDLSGMLSLANAHISQGANAETFAQFCDRIYQANTAGYSITTLEQVEQSDIEASVQWLQSVVGSQTYNTVVRLVFNFNDLNTAKTVSQALQAKSYTGYVLTYDPLNELVNILDCAICASIDYEVANGSINFNFQPAVGYTPITTLGTVVDYQSGKTNVSLIEDLNANFLSCVYSVGFGSQETVFYGFGLMAGAFGTEDVQVNEAALEQHLQVEIINTLAAVNKIKLQGKDAIDMVSAVIVQPLELFKTNGAIARNGVLSNSDKIAIVQATGNPDAAQAVMDTGYYFQVQPLTAEDIAARRVRVLICYLCGGVVNKVQIIDRIFQ